MVSSEHAHTNNSHYTISIKHLMNESTKDKRLIAATEKALASFDTLIEWADYIAFLSRLQKALALSDDPLVSRQRNYLPLPAQVALKLAQCLSPRLPNGVHQKTLALYSSIFHTLLDDAFNDTIQLWLPGLLPLVSYGSMSVKPLVLALYHDHVLPRANSLVLPVLCQPLMLLLLAGIDDVNSEVYSDSFALLDALAARVDPLRFWHCLFVCLLTAPERRMGVLNWCTGAGEAGDGPRFTSEAGGAGEKSGNKVSNGDNGDNGDNTSAVSSTSVVASAGTGSAGTGSAGTASAAEPGLLVRAFAAALETKTTFNPQTDIVVIRGFFDLLLSQVPLHSNLLCHVVTPADRELLVMACLRITLRRDMSLNRRLWLWLLGPENPSFSEDPDISGNPEAHDPRVRYFATYALPIVSNGVLSAINSLDTATRIQGLRICLALVMDRWEISHLVTPRLFVPMLRACYDVVSPGIGDFAGSGPKSGKSALSSDAAEVLAASKAFFDGVEASYIWNYIICTLILARDLEQPASGPSNFEMLAFLLKNFDFHDHELALHIPLAILCVLLKCPLSEESVLMLSLLLDLAQPRLFAPVTEEQKAGLSSETLISAIDSYYTGLCAGQEIKEPINGLVLSFAMLDSLKNWYVLSVTQHPELSGQVSEVLCDFLFTIPTKGDINPFQDLAILDTILSIPPFSFTGDDDSAQTNLALVFLVVQLTRYFVKNASFHQRNKLLKIILSNLWSALVSPYPANHEVEAVKCIFDLELSFDVHQVEAGVLELLVATPKDHRIDAFYKLWAHSADSNVAPTLLAGPLHVVLDDLYHKNGEWALMAARKLVHSIISDGSAGRLLKLATSPLLEFDLMRSEKSHISPHDDVKLFAYHVSVVYNIVHCNEKLLKETLNHEFVPSESAHKISLIRSNSWDISTYKLLVLAVMHKFLALRPPSCHQDLDDFVACTGKCLDLLATLVVGSEVDFESHLYRLIGYCFDVGEGYTQKPLALELVEAQYITTIMHFLDLANSMNVTLNVLHNDADSNDPLLVRFIIRGISRCHSAVVMEKWFALLTKSLYLFKESVFGVVLTLSDAVIQKISAYFDTVRTYGKINEATDVEAIFAILLAGLEDLLSISHSYLLSSSLHRNNTQANHAGGSTDHGFLGHVILGVFQIEPPSHKTDEQNKFYSILLAIQDAVRTAFAMWVWADAPKKEIGANEGRFVSGKSATQFCHKIRFRARKLLEAVMDLERHEVIETIIEHKCDTGVKVKMLHILDNGRSHVTFPHVINSIVVRCYPPAAPDKLRANVSSHVTAFELAQFAVPYLESVDADTVDEMWPTAAQFFREMLAHANHFRHVLAPFLVVSKVLVGKNGSRKGPEQRRVAKELGDFFARTVNAACAMATSEIAEASELPDLVKTLTPLAEHIASIVGDTDRCASVVSTIVNSVVPGKRKADPPAETLDLLIAIAKYHHNKTLWGYVQDRFQEEEFFRGKLGDPRWQMLVRTWISSETDRMGDLVARITPSTPSGAASIFVWNENADVEDKMLVLRRITFLLMVLSRDVFSRFLDELFSRLSHALTASCPPLYRAEAFTLLRAVALRFSETHLMPYWTTVTQNLVAVFTDVADRPTKELGLLSKDHVHVVFSACKLLDELVLLGLDEFSLREWLFVATGPDVVTASASGDGLMARISGKTDALVAKVHPVAVVHPQPHRKNRPLLCGQKSVENVAALRRFFGSFAFINYERVYSLQNVDIDACDDDVVADLAS